LDAQRQLLLALGIVMPRQRHPPGPPMTLGNMRKLGQNAG
jgi:hypothetical protein